jgi:hypothetical protein
MLAHNRSCGGRDPEPQHASFPIYWRAVVTIRWRVLRKADSTHTDLNVEKPGDLGAHGRGGELISVLQLFARGHL